MNEIVHDKAFVTPARSLATLRLGVTDDDRMVPVARTSGHRWFYWAAVVGIAVAITALEAEGANSFPAAFLAEMHALYGLR